MDEAFKWGSVFLQWPVDSGQVFTRFTVTLLLLLGEFLFANYALTDPRLQQRDWSKQVNKSETIRITSLICEMTYHSTIGIIKRGIIVKRYGGKKMNAALRH